MESDFIKTQLEEATYKLKEGTTTSYYWQEGTKILPNRICFREGEMAKVSKSGRNNLRPIVGQFLANFTKNEESPLKQAKPYKVRTQIWLNEDYPHFIGFGTLGISTPEGKTKDIGDLIVLFSSDNNDTLQVFVFPQMANPDGIINAFRYLNKQIKL